MFYKNEIPLQAVQNLYESISRSSAALLQAEGVPTKINNEMGTAYVVF
jgi:hypothetical protein